MKIENCTMTDYNQIVNEIVEFWGSNRTLHLHQPYLIHEFGNTAFVIKEKGKVIAYLFGFFSQTESVAYVHLVAVREQNQREGLGLKLYEHFINIAKSKGIAKIKAITTPSNTSSISFHENQIGMNMLGKPNEDGINIIKNYSGVKNDRVVFEKRID
ncbi:MAG: GNAT family N-acetyltransferase [Bacteroidales bacterium]|nr:GNAT family N-acetyltransferase [Bacteroidales bacterium]